MRDLLVAAGVDGEQADARWGEVQAAAVAAYGDLCPPDLSAKVAPGVPDLLEALAARPDDFRLSLVTGNLEPVARLKLARAGPRRALRAGPGRLRLRPLVARRAARDRPRPGRPARRGHASGRS